MQERVGHHVDRCSTTRPDARIDAVYIVCHWGVVQTLQGTCDTPSEVANLAQIECADFWGPREKSPHIEAPRSMI